MVAAAVRRGVPVTPRGKGTGNYGQGIPMAGGLVLDMSRARAVVEVGDGFVTAEAGAPMVALERAAEATGQQLWMYPSTAQSSLGGFLAGGSGGTGTIAHGTNDMGFVLALDVVHGDGSPELVHVEGDEAQRFVHNYGTAGIIARATVRLEPLQDWRGVFASFPDFAGALSVLRDMGRLQPLPRLVSADTPEVTATLPDDPAFPAGRASLRIIADERTVAAARALIEGAGGRVEDVAGRPAGGARAQHAQLQPPDRVAAEERARRLLPRRGRRRRAGRADRRGARGLRGRAAAHRGRPHRARSACSPAIYRSPEQVLDGHRGARRAGRRACTTRTSGTSTSSWRDGRDGPHAPTRAGLLNPGKLNPDYDGPAKGAIR